MKKLKLNENMGEVVKAHGYELDTTERYVINIEHELSEQSAIMAAIQSFGLPALKDYYQWLIDNGFDANMPNPTNSFVAQFYGVKALWKTDLSQGIVVRAEKEDDYFIIMECSRLNDGFKYTQIILTLGGCL